MIGPEIDESFEKKKSFFWSSLCVHLSKMLRGEKYINTHFFKIEKENENVVCFGIQLNVNTSSSYGMG